MDGFSVDDALAPLINMGQQLFEPPDVTGWDLGPSWFSTGAMLARMNFAAQLATNQKFNLRDARAARRQSPDALVSHLDRLTPPRRRAEHDAALTRLRAAPAGPGPARCAAAAEGAGLAHLIAGSAEYQLM